MISGEELVTAGQLDDMDFPDPWLVKTMGNRGKGNALASPESTTDPDKELSDFPGDLLAQGFVVMVPLILDNTPVGAVYLGPKESGHRYVGSDLEFLENALALTARRLKEILMVQKVVQERMAREQLDQLGQLKDDFLSKVAHDLRTPVTSLGWSVRNLLDGLAGELAPKQTKYLSTMDQAVTHLDGLVSNLLDVSRLEKTTIEVPVTSLSLEPVVHRATSTVAPLAAQRDITITTDLPSAISEVMANEGKLAEALVNLIANAVRYSPDQATVEVHAQDRSGEICLTVRDHGPGVTGIEDPFARFAQGTASPYSKRGGHGLGLTIVQQYVQLMGGRVLCANHRQGGAEFRIFLNRATSSQREQENEAR